LQKSKSYHYYEAHPFKAAMEDLFFRLLQSQRGGVFQRRNSVITPLIYFAGVVMTTCLGGAYYLRDYSTARVALILAALTQILFVPAVYLYLLVRRPNLLSSEEYRIQERALDVIAQTGARVPALSAPVPNPALAPGETTPEPADAN
jgi:hypothetical protein